LAIVLLSASASWLAAGMGDTPLPSSDPRVTPHDPPTLTLALIGAGTLAIYLAAKWRPQRSDVASWTGRLSDQSQRGMSDQDAEQRESRGAA
jgi:hypothetical protein